MKKGLLLLSLPLFLMSSDVNYNKALDVYNSKDYATSYKMFNELFQKDMLNPQINFYLGRSAFELGNYDRASVAFERVLLFDENHLRAKLELARVYIAQNMLQDAKALLEEVLETKPPEDVQKNIKALLTSIDNRDKKSFFKIFSTIGFGYDTNVNSNPGEENLVNYLANESGVEKDKVTADSELEDGFFQANLALRHVYDFGEKGSFYLVNSAMVYHQNYFDSETFDVLYLSFSSGINYDTEKYQISLPLYYDKIIYATNTLIDSYAVAPKISYKVDKDTSVSLFTKAQKKNYAKYSDRGRESDIFEVGSSVSTNLSSNFFNLSLSYLTEDKSRDLPDSFVNRDGISFKIGYYRDMTYCDLNALYTYRKLNYDDPVSKNSTSQREDDYNSFYVGLGKKIGSANLSLGYNYITSDSNYVPATYDKSVCALNLSVDF